MTDHSVKLPFPAWYVFDADGIRPQFAGSKIVAGPTRCLIVTKFKWKAE
jgi:hypothetical protein